MTEKFNQSKLWAKLLVVLPVAIAVFNHRGYGTPVTCGFEQITEAKGVNIYQKPNADNRLEYVTIVDTTKAKIKNLTGVVGANQAQVEKKILTRFWLDGVRQNTSGQKLKVVVNGAFFSTQQNPTGIAFGLKAGGKVISYGYAIGSEYPGEIRTLAFNSLLSSTSIQNYSITTFNRFPEVVGGLDINADKSAHQYVPRTFAGVQDSNSDGTNETIVLYASNYARQIDANRTLRCFGAIAQIMLDGGGSTGIIVDGKPLIDSSRPIPHALAVYGD